jgi:putative hydrolase of HD superfamily
MINIEPERLKQQLTFLFEIDKLKTIIRRNNLIATPERLENSAEHSWHLAFYVLALAEHANEEINVFRTMKMVLLHDIVEIDAGDTFAYDIQAVDTHDREVLAAKRIFGLLPADQAVEFMSLWEEFEAGATPEAKFAVSVDRLHPLMHNYVTGGGSWKRHDVKRPQVDKRMLPIQDGSVTLAETVKAILDDSVEQGMLKTS